MLEIKNREEKEVKSPVVTKYKGRYWLLSFEKSCLYGYYFVYLIGSEYKNNKFRLGVWCIIKGPLEKGVSNKYGFRIN